MRKKWEYKDIDEEKVKKIQDKFKVSNLLATVLVNREIVSEKDIEVFLNPTRNDFHDPYLMPDMEVAVNRIVKAIEKHEKVIIYGDYDVDGITSITVLKKFLKTCGLDAGYYIPNRLNEGYGLNKNAIDKIHEEGYTLIITVDCGISGIEEIEYANSLGLETIVTDHHEPMDILPPAIAVIDLKRKDNDKYPFNSLAGCGVVFKLTQALGMKLGLDEKEYLKYLDIVCVGTISDIVPLIDENRVIAKLGLKLVEVTKNPGLRALLNASGYKQVNSNTISFGIAPRINACGRMGCEEEALKLFLTDNIEEAEKITDELNQFNRERQEIEKNIFDEAIRMIEKEDKDNNAIVLGSQNWHHGVIGIVSSKITEIYYKPSILICFEGDKGKGSGRSIPGFDLHEALVNLSKHLDKYGGHEMAVGLSLDKKNFNRFKEDFNKYVNDKDISDLVPILDIDKQIEMKDVDSEIVKELDVLEPFGEANRKPVFVYKNLKIDSIRALSDGKHLKLTLKDGNILINAIGFNMGALSKEYTIGDKVDIAGMLEINSFNGRDFVQINMRDIMKSL
ncbi:MAG: single-stranded-DNA-specific exonuclease RecJ [Clostridia bacterium]|jgi:single-stranded-DNA-specific exonuclease|nr:single-stranded-DNA-specific exonuclease RecJ [Clostridia bacterium]